MTTDHTPLLSCWLHAAMSSFAIRRELSAIFGQPLYDFKINGAVPIPRIKQLFGAVKIFQIVSRPSFQPLARLFTIFWKKLMELSEKMNIKGNLHKFRTFCRTFEEIIFIFGETLRNTRTFIRTFTLPVYSTRITKNGANQALRFLNHNPKGNTPTSSPQQKKIPSIKLNGSLIKNYSDSRGLRLSPGQK